MSKPLRIIFAGTPEFSVSALAALADSRHEIVAVLTQPDRPAGRGRQLRASPVKEFAKLHGYLVLQPESLKPEAIQDQLRLFEADCMVVVAYGLILPEVVLNIPRYGCLNIHASLLPRWRGAAPIQRAIAAGDDQSGVTIMQMDKGLDTGNILAIQSCAIEVVDTGSTLHDKLSVIGASLLLEVLDQVQNKSLTAEVQDDSLACYAEKLTKAEAMIDWNSDVIEIERNIRAFNAWPVAHTWYKDKMLRVWEACPGAELERNNNVKSGEIMNADGTGILVACGRGALMLRRVQLAGKKQVSAQEFVNNRVLLGECFGKDQ